LDGDGDVVRVEGVARERKGMAEASIDVELLNAPPVGQEIGRGGALRVDEDGYLGELRDVDRVGELEVLGGIDAALPHEPEIELGGERVGLDVDLRDVLQIQPDADGL